MIDVQIDYPEAVKVQMDALRSHLAETTAAYHAEIERAMDLVRDAESMAEQDAEQRQVRHLTGELGRFRNGIVGELVRLHSMFAKESVTYILTTEEADALRGPLPELASHPH